MDNFEYVLAMEQKLCNIEKQHYDMIGHNDLLYIFKMFNKKFSEKAHGRTWRSIRKQYRGEFPSVKLDLSGFLQSYDFLFTSFVNEVMNCIYKISKGKSAKDMEMEAYHILSWDVVLCSINKKAKGGIDDYICNIEEQIYLMLNKSVLQQEKINMMLCNILTILPEPLDTYEFQIKNLISKFYDEYGSKSFQMDRVNFKKFDFKKFDLLARAFFYNENLLNNQFELINRTKGAYFLNNIQIEIRRKKREKSLSELKESMENEKYVHLLELIKIHNVLTFLNVNIEAKFGFKSSIGLGGVYVIKESGIL